MSLIGLKKEIQNSIEGRFHVEGHNQLLFDVKGLADKELTDKNILRIQRVFSSNAKNIKTWKTLLLVELENQEEIKHALRWASLVKDFLLDPETADLYLFICFKEKITLENCLRIESTEQFCRKYVLRPNESSQQLIERSFLSRLNNTPQDSIYLNPLNKAMSTTSDKYSWLTVQEQEKWIKAFLSDLSGGELIDEIFTENTVNE